MVLLVSRPSSTKENVAGLGRPPFALIRKARYESGSLAFKVVSRAQMSASVADMFPGMCSIIFNMSLSVSLPQVKASRMRKQPVNSCLDQFHQSNIFIVMPCVSKWRFLEASSCIRCRLIQCTLPCQIDSDLRQSLLPFV